MANSKVQACLINSTGITANDRKKIAALAKQYSTGDVTQDYILATTDMLTYLRDAKTAVEQAMANVKAGGDNVAVMPAEPTVEEDGTPKGEAAAAAKTAKIETEYGSAQEAWDDFAPDDVPWSALTTKEKEIWSEKVRANRVSQALAISIAGDARDRITNPDFPEGEEATDLTVLDALKDDISAAETAKDTKTFREAIQTVIFHAYFDTDSNSRKEITPLALEFLSRTDFSLSQIGEIDRIIVEQANGMESLEAVYTRGAAKGEYKPWFSYAMSRQLLPNIQTRLVGLPLDEAKQLVSDRLIKITQLPEETQKKVTKIASTEVPGAKGKITKDTLAQIVRTPQALLAQLIDDLITRNRTVRSLNQPVDNPDKAAERKSFPNVVELAKSLYGKLSEEGRNYIYRGKRLSEYFDDKGNPYILKSDGRYLIVPEAITPERQAEIEAQQKAAEQQDLADGIITSFDDAEEGNFIRADGVPLKEPMSLGRIRLLVNSFVNKLYAKPRIFIFRNREDLKAKNPDLYARAAAARRQGDFDTIEGMGYSFGPNVIIFTDFIRTEQQLKFVLAHETLGHFGFRAVLPKAELDRILNKIYDIDPNVRAAVDAAVEIRKMDKLEAIEEYMADYAADVDASILLRIWNALKDVLSKLTGIEFKDNDARYLVNLARKYVRRGDNGNILSATSIAQDLTALNDDAYSGRFAMKGVGDLASRAYSAGAMNRRYGPTGGLTGVVQAFKDKFLGAQQNVPGTVARILEQVQTLDNKARRSQGLSIIYNMLERQQQHARGLLSKYQRMTEYSHRPDFGTFGELTGVAGVTEEEKEKAGELLARAALYKAAQATDTAIKSYKSLVVIDPNTGEISIDPVVRAQLEKDGFVTAEEFRKGFDITYSNGEKINFRADVDENSDIWKIYVEMRQAVNEAAIDMMLSNYEASQVENNRIVNRLNDGRRSANVFSEDDLKAIRTAAQIYQDMRYKGSDVANAGVEVKKKAAAESEAFAIAFGRALFNDEVFKVWMRDTTADPAIVKDLEEFQKAEYDDIRNALPSLRAKIVGSKDAKQQQSFAIQKAVRDLFLFDLQSRNSDYYAKRTILGSYVPFTRRGTEQVKLVAYDKNGNPIKLDETIRATLPYFQFEDRAEALQAAEDVDKILGGDREWTMLDDDGAEVTVFLRPEVDRVRQTPDLTEAVNFNEFVYVLNRLNINLTPEVREKIVTTLTAQNARARKNLMRSGTEGWDKDVIRSVSEFLETTAHVSAKKLYRHRIDDVMLRESYWKGDRNLLNSLKQAVDNAQTDGERARAQRAYDEYAYMYKYMAPTGRGRTVQIAGKEEPTLGRGEDAREEAKQVLRWYSETSNITDSTEDMLSGETGSRLKMLTVLMQLGGSVATAVINLASLATHSLPYLSYYNPKTGVGGGYGEAKASSALWAAARDLKNPNLSEAEFLQKILNDNTYADYGLTEDEAEFLFDQTEQGTLQAAQFNALVGTARGKVFSNRAAAAIKLWMSMFSYTEQMNRRATALAAYRLEKERAVAQGMSQQVAIKEATEAARTAVNTSQGEYAMFNRPEMARGNVLQYVFMYKQFVIITVQLLRAMPKKGQAMMLGFLLLTSGLKGLPFAEDIFDIIDTIMQKLGLTTASIEKEMSEWIDAVAPGLTPVAMRGILDQMTGATLSSRLGMGDLVPLTGAFRAGASPIRELENFAGPVVGGVSGLVGMAGNLTQYGAEAIGLRDDTTSMESILRESPLAFVRAVGDGSAYLSDGRITNTRGQVVSEDAPITTTLARFLGFYPAIASQQNDIVRLSKYVSDYAKDIKAEYTSAYVKARLDGDAERMNQIVADVNEWNADAEGTGLVISNFRKSAERAAKEAERPTAARFMKSASKAVRPETAQLLEIYGIPVEEL
jgi:hypothetical protein